MLMPWLLVWPGHQLWWHWLGKIGGSFSCVFTFSTCIQHPWSWSIYKFYHGSIGYLICYKENQSWSSQWYSTCLLLWAKSTCWFLFNLYFLYVFVVLHPVLLASFCFSVPGWWHNESIFTCMFSPKIRKKCYGYVTDIRIRIWLNAQYVLDISSGILKLSPVASVSLHFTWNVYHWTPKNSPIFNSMNIHGTADQVLWNFFHLTKLKMIKCLLWKLITMTLKPD